MYCAFHSHCSAGIALGSCILCSWLLTADTRTESYSHFTHILTNSYISVSITSAASCWSSSSAIKSSILLLTNRERFKKRNKWSTYKCVTRKAMCTPTCVGTETLHTRMPLQHITPDFEARPCSVILHWLQRRGGRTGRSWWPIWKESQ